jgi:Putative binding domain, N-terminal
VVAPDTIGEPAAGGSQNVSVTTAAECSWSAVSNAAFIAIALGANGSGNGTVQLDIQSNTGPARSGTATIAGRTVSVNQDAGCTFSIAPSTQAVPVAGGSGSVIVTAGVGCAWTAVSNVPWVTVTNGGSGSGAGTVEFTVDANATGAARSGTITIAGQTFTVEQAGA